jgi:hypothetical protein
MKCEWYAGLTSGLSQAIISSPRRRRLRRIRMKLRGRIPAKGRTTSGRTLAKKPDNMGLPGFT